MRTNRREILKLSAGLVAASTLAPLGSARARSKTTPQSERGILIGEPTSEKIANQVFADGGNAIDAIVAGALAATVAAPHQTGIGGYGASGMIAFDGGKQVFALDANSMAPAAMTRDLFATQVDGKPKHDINFGWMSAGVPGILAGLQLLLDRFGTKSIEELLQPAIRICQEGYPWPANVAKIIQDGAKRFAADPGSKKLYFRNDRPLNAGDVFTNPELAEVLQSLAKANSLSPFYSGDIGQRIAEAFQKNGGLVTAQDMASYTARLTPPLSLKIDNKTIHTAPLTSGGLTVLQVLQTLNIIQWSKMPIGPDRTMTQVEAMRWAWRDRLSLLGDPAQVEVPQAKLLSEGYARETAESVQQAVKGRKPIPHRVVANGQTGTIHLSAMDDRGNFAALTLTHGGSFGSRVSVDGLGLTLGHGISRFDPSPDHPNSPGPKKRPLHNMVPTIVYEDGFPIMAAGGRGGRKIPNALLELMLQSVVLGRSITESIQAPRIHTEGTLAIEFEPKWNPIEVEAMKVAGYQVKQPASATLSSVAMEKGMAKGMR